MKYAFFFSASDIDNIVPSTLLWKRTVDDLPYTRYLIFEDDAEVITPSYPDDCLLVCVIEAESDHDEIIWNRVKLNGKI